MLGKAVQALRETTRRARRDERGASVLEWALIAAVVVVAASIIGAVIFGIVEDKSAQLEECADATVACNEAPAP